MTLELQMITQRNRCHLEKSATDCMVCDMTNKHKQKRKIRGLNSDLNQSFNIGKMKNMIALEKYYKNLEINKKAVISPVPETDKNTSTENIPADNMPTENTSTENQIKTVSNKTDEYASTDKFETLERMVSWSNFSELIQFLGAGYAWVFLIVTVSSVLSGCGSVPDNLTRLGTQSENLWVRLDIEYKAALPRAVREIREITGMVGEDEISGKVDFIFIWKPTLLGKTLNPNIKEFKRLVTDLQAIITKYEYIILQIKTAARNYSSNYRGSSRFRKYDDGWRLRELYVGGF